MRLVIISDMPHHTRDDGVIVGHGATVRELDALAGLFDQVRHVAFLYPGEPPTSARAYEARNVTIVPVSPAGGSALGDKLGVVGRMPGYAAVVAAELRAADAVHVRCPASISLVALAILTATRRPSRRWIKYAGNWRPQRAEPATYRLQRRWLERGLVRAQVTINGRWPGQPAHVHTFANPSLTDAELARGRRAADQKALAQPLRLVFAGHLAPWKGASIAIEAVERLRRQGLDVRLDIAGEGSEAAAMQADVEGRGLESVVVIHGALPRERLDMLYEAAHFVVLPSATEGWPKVLSEGMAWGAVPIATAVGSIPSTLSGLGCGTAVEAPPRAELFAGAIAAYAADPARWRRESTRAVEAAPTFGYTAYREAVRSLLDL